MQRKVPSDNPLNSKCKLSCCSSSFTALSSNRTSSSQSLGPEEYTPRANVVRRKLGTLTETQKAKAKRKQEARQQNELQNEVRRELAAASPKSHERAGFFLMLKAVLC